MVEQLLAQSELTLQRLDAIAFGRGPGSFTGVRLAVAVAQGLGFAAGLPLLPVSDLRALARQALAQDGAPARVLICQDARMTEVYWACFERPGAAATPEAVSPPAAVGLPQAWLDGGRVCAAGSGFEAYPALLENPALTLAPVWGELRPRAIEVAQLAAEDGLASAVPPDQAQPVYLRDEVATLPSRN